MFSREFETSRVLQFALGALLLNYFVVFFGWITRSYITKEALTYKTYVCPTYFQSCGDLYFLSSLPYGYSQSILYMGLFGVLLWATYLLTERKWREAQLVLILPFLWHFVNVFFLTALQAGNYEFYIAVYGIILLFLPHKEFFLKLSLVLFYSLSVVAKIHPSWITGSYFTALYQGLPVFPQWSIPFFSNAVMVLELVGAWFLMSKNQLLQRSALALFTFFHLYSGILVEYRYPTVVLPMILICFGPWYKPSTVPLDKKSIAGWILIFSMVGMQFIPRMIPGDEKLTLEGNNYGLHMFEANHQCISTITEHFENGDTNTRVQTNAVARNRCNPYNYMFLIRQRCEEDVERIAWHFDHSINGDPFLRIVDVENACDLEYKPFSRNSWIKSHEDEPEVIGLPVQNYYY